MPRIAHWLWGCKWGLSWQITPRALTAAIAEPDRAAAKRAFNAMMEMGRIDIARIEAGSLDETARIAADNPCLACGLAFEIRPIEPEQARAYRESNETPAGAGWLRGPRREA